MMVGYAKLASLRAVTVAEFEGDQICSIRSYWDDASLLQDLEAAGTD
jgi:hypothetical protein